ncbi:MAG: sigma-70 family RNA polymerase sigma factor [Bacteroidetes bacterium]|nr:sigma-70 family RNA polymerase sigma factor [Fibrella sp.]
MFFKRFRKRTPPSPPTTDGEFVAAYQATGDLELLGDLYERHIDMVYAVCFNYLRDEAESQDAVMHLFEQLITDLKRHEVQNFRSWLHTVARNYCLMQLRARRVYVSDAELTDADEDDTRPAADWLMTDADEGPDLEQHITQMHACLKTLPPAQQTCLDLFYLQQKSYADVAQLTGYDLKQVKSYLQNGRRNLKLCLDRHHDD